MVGAHGTTAWARRGASAREAPPVLPIRTAIRPVTRGSRSRPDDEVRTGHVLTGIDDRPTNMVEFTKMAIALLEQCIDRL